MIKKMVILLLANFFLMNSFAEESKRTTSSTAYRCVTVLEKRDQMVANPSAGSQQQAINLKEEEECQALKDVASLNKEQLTTDQESAKTMDGKITCTKKAGYTIDFASCEKALKTYDWIKNAELFLTMQEQVRTDGLTKRGQEEVARRSAAGDGQQAAIDGAIAMNNHMKQLNQERAAAYVLAVGALGKAVHDWVETDDKGLAKFCNGRPGGCQQSILKAKAASQSEVIANNPAKSKFKAALWEFVALGAKAGIAANQFNNVAGKLEGAKANELSQDDNIMLDKCVIAPSDPTCITPGARVAGERFQGGDFTMGPGGNNAFDMGDGTNTAFGEAGDLTDIKDPQSVASVNSPFMDAAKEANGILNPAAAASPGQGGGGAGGGGGGAGGGGGGGSASLGDDLQGVADNANKENEIKAKKADGGYASSEGTKGFSAVKTSKEESNPFASLFDSKSAGGGVEEDRSIASGDIDGAASGLFQKISKRYSQVQADKRLEPGNLE